MNNSETESYWVAYNKSRPNVTIRVPERVKCFLSEEFSEYPLTMSKIIMIALYEWTQANKDWKNTSYKEMQRNIELAKRLHRDEIKW